MRAKRERLPRSWRYDYAKLAFERLRWSSGRIAVPAATPVPARTRARDADGGGVSALAVENAGGLVHAGSTYLQSEGAARESRVTLLALADAARAFPDRVAAIHRRIVAPETDRFTALATAFQNCGAYVDVPDGVALDAPLQLLWTARPGVIDAVFPHTVVRIGRHARATIVERHIAQSETFACGIVEIDLAEGARLDYVVAQQTDESSRLFFRRGARCAQGAHIRWHVAEHGGGLVRTALRSTLAATHASAEVNAFFFARGFEHVDLSVEFEHRAAETESAAIVRGAAYDRGRARFRGTIAVRSEARDARAALRFEGLLLSRRAAVDVRSPLGAASTGASVENLAAVGALDEDELFYVQSRGIERRNAERMLALAFFEPAIRNFPGAALRDEMRSILDAHLDEIPDTFAS